MKRCTPFVGVGFLLVFSYTIFSGWKTSTTFLPDFSIFYASALDLSHHLSPYIDKTLFTAFNYPLATAVLFIPFTFFPLHIAQQLFVSINILSVFCITYMSMWVLKKRFSLPIFLGVVSLIFLAFPTKFTLGMGQVNLAAYLFLLIGYGLHTNKNSTWSTLFLVLAILLKPLLGFTLVIFLFEKKWQELLLVVGIVFLCVLSVPYIFQQLNANQLFLQSIVQQSLAGREVYYNQGLLGFIARLVYSLPLRGVLNIFITIQLLFFAFWKLQHGMFVEKLSLFLTLLVIIDPLSWQHHFVFLILPFLTTFFLIQKKKGGKKILYGLFALSYILVSVNIKNPQAYQVFPAVLLLSNQFYGAVVLFFLQLM